MSAVRRLSTLASLGLMACATAAPPPAAPPTTPAPRAILAWTRSDPPGSLPALPRTAPPRHLQVMPNGLRVVVVEHHARPLVAIRLIFPTGAAADPALESGATWLAMEGLAGKYDDKNELGDPADLAEKSARRLIGELGGRLVVGTAADYSAIGIDGFSRDTPLYLRELLQLVKEPRCGETTYGALVDAVTDELNVLELSDAAVLEEHLGRLGFGEGSPYARPIYGTPASLSRLGLEEVATRQQELLTPVGATLLVAGDVEPAALFRAVRSSLGAWYPQVNRPSRKPAAGPPLGRRRHVTLLPRTGSRTTLVCAARRFSDKEVSPPVLAVVTQMLSARMDRSLRDEHTLTYGAWATQVRHRGMRALLACTRLDVTQTTAGLRAFLEGFRSLSRIAPGEDDAEVEAAKAVLSAKWQASEDSLTEAVVQYELELGLGGQLPDAARVAELRAVTTAEVQSLARKVSDPALLQLVTSGEPEIIRTAVRELKLGLVRTPRLDRVPTDD